MDKKTEVDWQIFAARLEHEFANDLFDCSDRYEMMYIKKQLKKEMPELSEARIDYVLDQCCTMLPAPRTIRDFVFCLQKLVS
jgi:hypothetical protein